MFLFFLLISLCFLGKKCDIKLFLCSVIFVGIYFTLNINYYNFVAEESYIEKEFEVLEKYDEYSIVGVNNEKYLIYNNDFTFYKGSIIYLNGNVEKIKDTYNSFYNYLNKKGVSYKINYSRLYILENNKPLNELIINSLLKNKSDISKSYLKLILFNVKDVINEEFYNSFSIFSLTYLIAVSGFHIRLLLSFFKKIFHKNTIGYIVVGFYLYLLDFSISSYRAFLCYLFKKINKSFKFKLSNNDVISLIGIVFIFINPSIMFSYSFIFSFLSTFVIEIFKVYSKRKILISLYIYLINIPIVLLSYYKLNLATLLLSSILTLPISFLYVFSFLFLFLDKFYLLYELFVSLFVKALSFLDNFNFVLIFGKPNVSIIIIYYLLLFLFFVYKERKKCVRLVYFIGLILVLFYQYFIPILNSNEQVYFLNVGQGDCSIFLIPNSKEVVLLDTGGSNYSDIARSKIIPFLESKGINKISKVIISHDDFDHNGALSSLMENFSVEEVIETSNIEGTNIGSKYFKNLNINDRRDNDGSLVLYGEYAGYQLLLMGDAGVDIEKKIMNDINKVDIVKIGHHGSNTSSDYEFLDKIDGKVAIISVGKNNKYGHPHDEVIKNLEELGYFVFRTDYHNNVGFGKNIFNLSFVDYFK